MMYGERNPALPLLKTLPGRLPAMPTPSYALSAAAPQAPAPRSWLGCVVQEECRTQQRAAGVEGSMHAPSHAPPLPELGMPNAEPPSSCPTTAGSRCEVFRSHRKAENRREAGNKGGKTPGEQLLPMGQGSSGGLWSITGLRLPPPSTPGVITPLAALFLQPHELVELSKH